MAAAAPPPPAPPPGSAYDEGSGARAHRRLSRRRSSAVTTGGGGPEGPRMKPRASIAIAGGGGIGGRLEHRVAALMQRQRELRATAAAGRPLHIGHVERFAQEAGAAALLCCQRPPLLDDAKQLLDSLADLVDENSPVGTSLPADGRSRLQASACSNYAVFFKHTGQWDDALRECTRALHIFRTLPDAPTGDVAAAGLNMAAILGRLGRHRGAVQHARGAVQLLETCGHEDTAGPMLAVALYNLSVELQYCRDWQGARDAVVRAHRVARRALPQSDPTAIAISSLLRSNTRRKLRSVATVSAPRSARADGAPAADHLAEKGGGGEEPEARGVHAVDHSGGQQPNHDFQGWGEGDAVRTETVEHSPRACHRPSPMPLLGSARLSDRSSVPSFLPPISAYSSPNASPLGRALTPLVVSDRTPAGSVFAGHSAERSLNSMSRLVLTPVVGDSQPLPRPPPLPSTGRAPRPPPPHSDPDACRPGLAATAPPPGRAAGATGAGASRPASAESSPSPSWVVRRAPSPAPLGPEACAWDTSPAAPVLSPSLQQSAAASREAAAATASGEATASAPPGVSQSPLSGRGTTTQGRSPRGRTTPGDAVCMAPSAAHLDRAVVGMLCRSLNYSSDKAMKKVGRAGSGFHNVAMSQKAHGHNLRRCQKHMASVVQGLGWQRRRRVHAAEVIQRGYRCACARLELYNRRQLLYQYLYEKQTFMANLIKGRIRSWRAQRWLLYQRAEVAERRRLRAEREDREDLAACVLQRFWRVHRARRELRTRKALADQALAEVRMRRLALVCVGVQRWWRWVRIRKGYWRRRALEVIADRERAEAAGRRQRAATRLQARWRGVLDRACARAYRKRRAAAAAEHRRIVGQAVNVVHFVLRSVCLRRRRAQVLAAAAARAAAAIPQEAAARLQRAWRSWVARRELRLRQSVAARRRSAACCIQRMARCRRARGEARVRRCVRRTLLREQQAKELQRERAARCIQRAARCHRARRRARQLRAEQGRRILAAAERMQRWARVQLARRELARRRAARRVQRERSTKAHDAQCYQAACRIQCAWLRLRGRRKYRAGLRELEQCRAMARALAREEATQRRSAEAVQRMGRGLLCRQGLPRSARRRAAAARRIQALHRGGAARAACREHRAALERHRKQLEFHQELQWELLREKLEELAAIELEEREAEEEDEEMGRRRCAVRALAAGLPLGPGALMPPPSPLAPSDSNSSGCYD